MRIAEIQRFCMHDGPGVRTTVFLKGCPLRCLWCHNPETQRRKPEILFFESKCMGCGACGTCDENAHGFSVAHVFDRSRCIACGACAQNCPTGALELCGTDMTAEEVFRIVQKDRAFYGTAGGITISGGEPFLQAEETLALLKLCRDNGIHTAVETCGYFSPEILKHAVPLTDLFLWDIKDTDPQRHQRYTGVSNERILENLLAADALGARTRIRCILVAGVNTTQAHYGAVAGLVRKLHHCQGVELIPYHAYGGAKAVAVGKADNGNDSWIPDREMIAVAEAALLGQGIRVIPH